MKIILLVFCIIISLIIDYVLFIPSSPVNLVVSVFFGENHTFFTLFDLILSNLIFLGLYKGLSKIVGDSFK